MNTESSHFLTKLPVWSRTIEPEQELAYRDLLTTAVAFLGLAADARRELVKNYSSQHCLPRFDLERASAIYVFFRVIFKLPSQQPRLQAQVFGGWLHPSIDADQPYFDLSWPVKFDVNDGPLVIDRFVGYFGKGYDALGEYDYFAGRFPFREPAELQKLLVHY